MGGGAIEIISPESGSLIIPQNLPVHVHGSSHGQFLYGESQQDPSYNKRKLYCWIVCTMLVEAMQLSTAHVRSTHKKIFGYLGAYASTRIELRFRDFRQLFE